MRTIVAFLLMSALALPGALAITPDDPVARPGVAWVDPSLHATPEQVEMLSQARLAALIDDGQYRPAAGSPLWRLATGEDARGEDGARVLRTLRSSAHLTTLAEGRDLRSPGPLTTTEMRRTTMDVRDATPSSSSSSFDPNVRVNSNPFSRQNEVSMDSDSTGALYAGWNDAAQGNKCGYGGSTDGGRTWSNTDYYLGPKSEAGDPVVRAHGRVIWRLCMSFDRSPLSAAIMVSQSIDSGATWGPWIDSSLGQSGATNDKPWIDFDGDHIYIQVYDLGPQAFWKSDDGGRSWGPKQIVGSGQGNCIIAGSNGVVVTGWGWGGSRIMRSTNWGDNFSVATSGFVTGQGGSNPRSAPLLTCGASADKRHMYFSWAQQFGGVEQTFAIHSGDEGATWDAPVRVAPGSNRQIMPGVDVTLDDVAHVAWTEFVGGKVEAFYSNSTDGGKNWSAPMKATDASGDIATDFMGDYAAVDASRQGRVGYAFCDTREGNGGDIYFAGFQHGPAGGGGNVARVEVTPSIANITAEQTQQFAAKAYDGAGNQVNSTFVWSTTGGTVDTAGKYAPHRAGAFTVTADVFGKSGSAKVNIAPGAPVVLAVTPSNPTIGADQKLAFSAVGRDVRGNTFALAPVHWTVVGGAANGSIDANGLYDPRNTGDHTVEAHHDASGLGNSTVVTVVPGPLYSVVVSPPAPRITADEKLQFAAIGQDVKGNQVTITPTWAAEKGNITAEGLYRPTKTGKWLVTASAAGRSGNATVEVVQGALVLLRVAPDTKTITADETLLLTATGIDAKGNEAPAAVSWSTEDGAISAAGNFSPNRTGIWTITATAGAINAIAKVTVEPGRLASVSVEPGSVALDKGHSGQFKVKPRDAKGNHLKSFRVAWEIAGDSVGTIDTSTGLFTAQAAGEATVRAKVTAGADVKVAEANVLVRGGLTDIKGGGQLPYLAAGLAAAAAAVAILLMMRRRKRRRTVEARSYVSGGAPKQEQRKAEAGPEGAGAKGSSKG